MSQIEWLFEYYFRHSCLTVFSTSFSVKGDLRVISSLFGQGYGQWQLNLMEIGFDVITRFVLRIGQEPR